MALSTNLKRCCEFSLTAQRCFSSVAATTRSSSYMLLLRREYSDDQKPAKCKVALVTGRARGIGYHISEHLLKAGAEVVVLGDIPNEELEEATCKLNERYGENKAFFQPCDVTKQDEMEKIFKCTKDRFGQLDVVVNNAGIAESDWRKIININVTRLVFGTLLGFQGTHSGGKGGHIINVASILGLQPLLSMPVYCGTKSFVVDFTKSMGSDYYNNMTKVKVMAVCPGVTDTEIVRNAGKATLPGFDSLDKEAAKSLASLASQGQHEENKTLMDILRNTENGTIWVSEQNELYRIRKSDPFELMEISASGSGKKKDHCRNDKCKKKDDKKKKGPSDHKKDHCKNEKCKT